MAIELEILHRQAAKPVDAPPACAAAAAGRKPVLVGHSMGGLVVQKYLEGGHGILHAVLLAAVPPQGAWRVALKLTARHPLAALNANLTWRL